METDNMITKSHPNMTHRLLPAVLPVVFIAITYVDPGKWVAAIEGGARFGYDLIVLTFVFSLAAVLCQYLSASIAVVTGRDLAQICSTEYDTITCVFLGVQAELSMIALDLTMILGTAHVLSLTFGIGLFTCVILTSLDAFLFPVFSSYLENGKAKFVCMWFATVALFSYFFGVVTSQRDTPLSMGGMLTNLSGESAFALMGLLGASIMPHNFYSHSSMVQQDQGPTQITKGALCNDHLFAISGVFSGIFVINCILMNSAANVFYSTGLDLLTFQDALSLMDQVFKSLMAPFALVLVLVLSYHTTALTWKFSGQSVLNFFKVNIPGWCHHSTIRFISLIPALLSTWHSGAEGAYQLMLVTQVMVAILLPSSVVPLFRVASSRSIMGLNKISQLVEYLIWVTYVGILGLVIVFVVEMVFGNSEWASNLRWTMWVPYVFILVTAGFSISLMLWLVVTPLKSARKPERNVQDVVQESSFIESSFIEEKVESPKEIQEMMSTHEPDLDSAREYNLPDDILDYDNGPRLTTIEENTSYVIPSIQPPDDSPTRVESVPSPVFEKEIDESVEKTLRIDENVRSVKEPDLGYLEPEDVQKSVSGSGTGTDQSPTSNGPGSFRSLGGKSDDIMSGPASLSKLGGLGRAARRQLATTLDDFWKLLFDLHGEITQDAKSFKLDKLFGIDSKVNVKGSPVVTNITSPEVDPVFRLQRGSTSLLTGYQQLLDAYTSNQGLNVMDPEKRYHSLKIPHASGPYMDQPATVHGYQIKSYINQTKQNSDYFQNQLDPLSPNSPPLVSSTFKSPVTVTKTQQNGLRPAKPPGFPDPVVSRNNSMQPERTYNNVQVQVQVQPVGPVENVHEKKYYSMPDISGLMPNRGSKILPERDSGSRYGTLGPSVYSGPLYRSGTISGYGGLLHSNLSRDAAAYHPVSTYGSSYGSGSRSGSDTWSMWSKQPSEQFGVAEKVNPRPELTTQETPTNTVDYEGNLLKSFRLCIYKLLKLEGSDWLFDQNGGVDEDLVDRVAARERFLYEIEVNRVCRSGGTKVDETEYNKYLVTSVPNCGDECVWKVELIKSFGVWCMHRILELSLMESRPELWGKYTYVLNRLQGIIEPAFSKPRVPTSRCFCLQVPDSCQQKLSPPKSTTSFPPASKPSRGKCTTAASLLDIVKNVETAISCRKGRPGTAAGDVAFPKGKENLASVLKRYKRRLLAVAPDGLSRSP